jgi:hypothetical protein
MKEWTDGETQYARNTSLDHLDPIHAFDLAAVPDKYSGDATTEVV